MHDDSATRPVMILFGAACNYVAACRSIGNYLARSEANERGQLAGRRTAGVADNIGSKQ